MNRLANQAERYVPYTQHARGELGPADAIVLAEGVRGTLLQHRNSGTLVEPGEPYFGHS